MTGSRNTSLNYVGDYAYNGQGQRVYAHTDGKRTLYPNQFVEYRLNGVGPGGWMTKYYYMGSQRLAMQDESGDLYFFVNDHLGSTSLTLNSSGVQVAELRYDVRGKTI